MDLINFLDIHYSMNYKIFRLCRNKKTYQKLLKEESFYKLPKTDYLFDIDLFQFINHIIKNEPYDYALICHDDVILPQEIERYLEECIESMDSYVGRNNWGIIGNAGVEIFSKKTLTYISDPHTKFLPPKTKKPKLVESVDGNTMLLNLKNLRMHGVELPNYISGYHLYDLILSIESYRKGLVCGVSSLLYVKHLSPGNYETFIEASEKNCIQKYFKKNFSNSKITTINGLIEIKREYKNLENLRYQQDSIEDVTFNSIKNIFKHHKIELNILIRIHKPSPKIHRLLESIRILNLLVDKNVNISIHLGVNNISKTKITAYINELKNTYSDLKIYDIYIPKTNRYPRLQALRSLAENLPNKLNSYVWFVDYDDYIFPTIEKYLQIILKDSDITIGESVAFSEKWSKNDFAPISSTFNTKFFCSDVDYIYTGNTSVPICSIIYSTNIIKSVFKQNDPIGDYYEDYAILLLASLSGDIRSYPILFAGISYHGENTVTEIDRTHWDYSYTSFMAYIVNRGITNTNTYNILLNYSKKFGELNSELSEFIGFKQGYIWRILKKYRFFKRRLLRK